MEVKESENNTAKSLGSIESSHTRKTYSYKHYIEKKIDPDTHTLLHLPTHENRTSPSPNPTAIEK